MSPAGAGVSAAGGEERRTFEEILAELEAITDQLASGEMGIESAADLYERACELHALAAERLDQVKSRVERLSTPGALED
jgi:exodeoxyribonuclease VII small subunit